MNTYPASQPVVVGFDGSRPSMNALVWAARESAFRGEALLLLHVRRASALSTPVETLLRSGIRQARDASPLARLRVRVVMDDVDTALVAASGGASLVVLGLDVNRPRADHGLRGPIEDRVANNARCPLVLVPNMGSSLPHPNVVAIVTGDSPGMYAAALAAQEAARRHARLFLYVRTIEDNPSTAELMDRTMLEITFDHPELPVRVAPVNGGRKMTMAWDLMDRLALVVTNTQATEDRWSIRSDPYGTLLARELNVPIMLVTPLALRSTRHANPNVSIEAASA